MKKSMIRYLKKSKMNIYLIVGVLCLVYFIGVTVFGGTGTSFYLIWGLLAAGFLALGICKRQGLLERWLPVYIRRGSFILMLAAVVLFVVVEGFIVSGFFQEGGPGLDYIIVLGAQVREDGPSRVLKMRLDEACRYLEQNKETIVIVSGGQGADEPEPEAVCMKRYLMENGIEEERIRAEDESTDTYENLKFSKKFIEGEEKSIGVVSNNFHVFRAVKIAEKAGYHRVEGIAAPSYPALQPNNMLREFFGVMKDYLFGNM